MKRFILPFLAMAGLVFGCSPEELDAPLASTALQSNETELTAKAVHRPFKLSGEGTLNVAANTTACPGLMQLTVNGTGNATHLGKFEVSLVWCTNFTDINYATGTQVAANGDELYFRLAGMGYDADGEWADYVYEGGTGRFENANGELHERIYTTFVDPVNAVYTSTANGWLSY